MHDKRLFQETRAQRGQVPYRKKTLEQSHINALQQVVDENPEYYLDEIAEALFLRTGALYSPSTISKVLRHDLH